MSPDSFLWRLLQDDPDRYIYEAVRHGVVDEQGNVLKLPKEIEAGIKDVSKRDGWNRPAAEPFALPTETWREHVARRHRCLELREKLRKGEIHDINDLITVNLDLWQFARDVIVTSEGPELLRAFWQAIGRVTVLDPTCGSGAFLFAALRILETLYSDCIERMEQFVEDADSAQRHKEKFKDFKQTLAQLAEHPNDRYFILKSIIINNLFGVDIMEEAVEICKLRLFLKLVAQVESVEQIEPLPDIDFNIRSGNTLVGYVSLEEIKKSQAGKLGFAAAEIQRIEEDALAVEKCFDQFRAQQTQHGGKVTVEDKFELRRRLSKLEEELDQYLAGEYGVKLEKQKDFDAWKASHQPFHWFVEFYGIMANGGFDVIIGNPPWKEYAAVRKTYEVRGFVTTACGNLHGICTERSLRLRSAAGRFSFIVQLPLTCSSRMVSVRNCLRAASDPLHVVSFDDRPGKLFDGLQHCRSVIFVSAATSRGDGRLFTTRYQRWPTETRPVLFAQIEYADATSIGVFDNLFGKMATEVEVNAFRRLVKAADTTIGAKRSGRETPNFVFYQEATQYWTKATIGLPFYRKDGVEGPPAHGRYIYFDTKGKAAAAMAILNSSIFYAYFVAFSDCFHLSDGLVSSFPIPSGALDDPELQKLGTQLQKSLVKHAVNKTISTRDGSQIEYAEFNASKCKSEIDCIDGSMAEYYRFTPEELDFIVNYDIKYRIGQDGAADEE